LAYLRVVAGVDADSTSFFVHTRVNSAFIFVYQMLNLNRRVDGDVNIEGGGDGN
jgi:hypothetical protein